MSAFTTAIQHSIRSPSHSDQTRKEIKVILIVKEEVKLSLFAHDKIVYTENPRDSTKKPLGLISEFGKAAGYNVNIQKLKAVLYINKEISEIEIKKKSHLI